MQNTMNLPWLKKRNRLRGCIGIEQHNGQNWAVLRTPRGVEKSYHPNEGEEGFEGLAEWLKEEQLTELPVIACLDVGKYDLHLIEAPPVPEEELSDALSFRIAELTGGSAEGKILQAFPLPGNIYQGRMSMAYAAITDHDYIKELVGFCRHNGLHLKHISINELSVLNLLAHTEQPNNVAVLRLEAHSGIVYIYRNGAFYFARQISLGTEDLNQPKDTEADDGSGLTIAPVNNRLDVLALELQRSMDYFESQLGLGAVDQLWVMRPDYADITETLLDLEEYLNTPVAALSLESHFNRQEEEQPLTASLAMALGGALSYELGN